MRSERHGRAQQLAFAAKTVTGMHKSMAAVQNERDLGELQKTARKLARDRNFQHRDRVKALQSDADFNDLGALKQDLFNM